MSDIDKTKRLSFNTCFYIYSGFTYKFFCFTYFLTFTYVNIVKYNFRTKEYVINIVLY